MMSIPRAITPIYKTPKINQVIPLHEGLIEVTDDQNRTSLGNGTIEQEWLPEPRVWLDCVYETNTSMEKPSAQIALATNGKRFGITVTSYGLGSDGSKIYGTLAGLPNGLTRGGSETIHSMIFHLPNFSYFNGAQIGDGNAYDEQVWNGRANLRLDDWSITIDSIAGYNLIAEDELENSSGSKITHVGRVERTNQSKFSFSDVQPVLSSLYLYLSFYRGSWVGPMLSVGLDQHGDRIFEEWGQANVRKCERVQTWANRQSAESLELPFPGFYTKCQSLMWSDPIRRSMAWYVECNRRASGLEASIILIQTVIELLGWAILVEDSKTISQKGFNDLPATDKIRLTLSSCEIPRDIPDYLPFLNQLAAQFSWLDGPECLVGMRNALVHPQLKNRKKIGKMSSGGIFEIWNLGMRYLDLILLKLLDYSGTCFNRMKREVSYHEALERVPWA